jgi:hypothetical protein
MTDNAAAPKTSATETSAPSGALHGALFFVQGLLALTFFGGGLWKLATPIAEIAQMMPWVGEVEPGFFYFTALVDILGGLGVILPSVTRIKPQLTAIAALGCVALQICAAGFHLSRGEAANTPLNFLLIGLSLFVFWGRRSRCPISAR